jgi:battenin
MLPLFIVYFSEYAMQSGTWAAIGFPVEDEGARKKFYEYANWLYQAGVFVSRSSGTLVQANMLVLQLMPVLQTALLVLFTFIAVYQFLYGWGLLAVCFVVGLLGGGVYAPPQPITRASPTPRALTLSSASLALPSALASPARRYVNAFTRISVDVEKGPRQEVALAIVSVADSFGILFADVAGLFLQACIYKHHGLDGAKMTCPF